MYIYKTTCLVNGKIYIGQCCRTPERSVSYLGSGSRLSLAIQKYSKENFAKEILMRDIPTQKQLDIWEQIYIKKFNACDRSVGYNLLPGTSNKFGAGTPIQQPELRDEIIRKTIEACSKPEVRRKMSMAMKEFWETADDQRKRFSELAKLNTGSKNPNFGNKWSDEKKEHMRQQIKRWCGSGEKNTNFGNKWSDEQKKGLSEKTKERFKKEPNPMTNRKRITNGTENKAIPASEPLPEGWRYGLTMKPRQKK